MQWTANVELRSPTLRHSDVFNLIAFAADSEADAARFAAEASAKKVYGDNGAAGAINCLHAPLYRAAIGVRDNFTLRGCTASILIRKYEPVIYDKRNQN